MPNCSSGLRTKKGRAARIVFIPPGRSVECEIVCSEGNATSIVCAAAHLRDERPRIRRGRVENGWQRMICCCGSPSPPDLGGSPPPTHRTITLKAANDLAIFASPFLKHIHRQKHVQSWGGRSLNPRKTLNCGGFITKALKHSFMSVFF